VQDYEDKRLPFPEFGAQKAAGAFPFKSVPVLDIGGERYAQSGAILRYVGKLAGLYPEDPVAALRVDMAMEAMEEL
jgi:prostaglandin-H2 D-isomerase / glutathione transferase